VNTEKFLLVSKFTGSNQQSGFHRNFENLGREKKTFVVKSETTLSWLEYTYAYMCVLRGMPTHIHGADDTSSCSGLPSPSEYASWPCMGAR
jgi:hypothetical protein